MEESFLDEGSRYVMLKLSSDLDVGTEEELKKSICPFTVCYYIYNVITKAFIEYVEANAAIKAKIKQHQQ